MKLFFYEIKCKPFWLETALSQQAPIGEISYARDYRKSTNQQTNQPIKQANKYEYEYECPFKCTHK